MSAAIKTSITYRPSVCHQTDDEHIHYNLILTDPTNFDLADFVKIAGRLGTRTAGLTIQAIQQRLFIGDSLTNIGINSLLIERLPTYQICHKGEGTSPSIDWDMPV